MVIRFKCPKCSKVLSVKDENAGKKGRCPKCKEIVVVPKAENSEAQPTRGVILTQDPNTHQENKQSGQPNAKVNVSDNVRSSKKWKYGIGILCVLVVIGLWRGCSERALEKESINEMQQQWDETTTEINRIKKDDIATRAAKRLKSMTIGQVRQLVLNWGYGKLPEQQVEGADEIRKELEVLEKQLTEQEAKDKNELELLASQMKEQRVEYDKKQSLLRKQESKQLHEHLRPDVPQEEYDKLKRQFTANGFRRSHMRQELINKGRREYRSLEDQFRVQQREFYNKKISPLKERLEPDDSVKTFYNVFGKPKDKSLIGDNYYFQYRCKDGIVLLEINAHYFDNDKVLIQSVSVL